MNELILLATAELAHFLNARLPDLSADWWQKLVVDRLSFQQQRVVQEQGYHELQQLDFAALLRVFDQNWYELSDSARLPREGRTWVKELQTVRNKWAHLPARSMPVSEVYRDADTLERLLDMIGAAPTVTSAVAAAKAVALSTMAGSGSHGAQGSEQPRRADRAMEDSVRPSPASLAPGGPLFKLGDLVALRSNPSALMPVIAVLPGGAECRYQVFQNNTTVVYYERQLQLRPPSQKRRTLSAAELRACLTSLQILSPSTANLFSLRSGRVQFVPYQCRPVLKLIRAERPRLLIADEVGVGKTIEAGLIIRELQARMDISSILVICPKPLVAERKWFAEMKRFDQHFAALDGPLLRHCLRETHLEGEWPEQYAKVILPFSLFDSDLLFGQHNRNRAGGQGLLSLDPPPRFDLVIVDEAHHIRNVDTYLHQGVRFFSENAQALLLLTATPVQLGSEDLFTLLNVLRPDLVIDRASFEQMAEPNRHIYTAVQHCRAAQAGWQGKVRDSLDEVARTEWGRLFIRESPPFQHIYDQLRDVALDDSTRVGLTRGIEELYTFSSLINRTRRRDIGEFTTRKPETVTVEFTTEQKQLHDGLLDVIARILAYCHGQQNVKFLMTTIRRQAASCLYGLAPLLSDILAGKLDRLELMEASDGDLDANLDFVDEVRCDIEALLGLARTLDPLDPKVEAFVRALSDKSKLENNKALVFSTFRHTLSYLVTHTRRAGLRYGLIHGDVPDEERVELRRRFALPKEDPDALDVLLSSEVGCEGLDFQVCDLLINYDLPWNPMRIEQRIGRIDRYGQKSEAVAVVNLITPGTVDAEIYERCLWRIGVFHHAVGGSEEILGQITQELHHIAESFELTADERAHRLRQLADNGIRQIREEQELESREAELFGLSIPRQTWREEIEAAESFWLSPTAIQSSVETYLAALLQSGLDHVLGEKQLKTLRLSQDARDRLLQDFRRLPRSVEPLAREWEKWLKGAQPTITITFDQQTAVANPQAVHLSVVHPLVRQAARFLALDEPVYVALEAHCPGLPRGEHAFALYKWTKDGVKRDEVLVAVAAEPKIEAALLTLLQSATDAEQLALPDAALCEALDVRHHDKWMEARANHIAENGLFVEHRLQSLTVSHRARCQAIQDQVEGATNQKIRLMKESELARANADFGRRREETQRAASSADILTSPVVFGTILVTSKEAK
ncbi:MAG: RNA polymerase-associated protein RapA [Chloroflexi bacterium ADurb.Bin180]|nr:MAG: RNA polymerase-associated protein RapA [Chloroflexi bacterium ADurb.Bin180]